MMYIFVQFVRNFKNSLCKVMCTLVTRLFVFQIKRLPSLLPASCFNPSFPGLSTTSDWVHRVWSDIQRASSTIQRTTGELHGDLIFQLFLGLHHLDIWFHQLQDTSSLFGRSTSAIGRPSSSTPPLTMVTRPSPLGTSTLTTMSTTTKTTPSPGNTLNLYCRYDCCHCCWAYAEVFFILLQLFRQLLTSEERR